MTSANRPATALQPAVPDEFAKGGASDGVIGEGIPVPAVLQELWLLPRNSAIAFMLAYRRVISPLYGQVCRYHPSCSRYALEVLQRQGLVLGAAFTAWRLLRCNPFSAGGIDDPPERNHQIFSTNARGFVRPTLRKA